MQCLCVFPDTFYMTTLCCFVAIDEEWFYLGKNFKIYNVTEINQWNLDATNKHFSSLLRIIVDFWLFLKKYYYYIPLYRDEITNPLYYTIPNRVKLQIGGRRKVPDTMEPPPPPERLEEVPPSPDSNLSPTQPQPPASAATLNNGPPVKPPRPKVPIYANIDDVERQTHGAASDSGSSAANPGLRSSLFFPCVSLVSSVFA